MHSNVLKIGMRKFRAHLPQYLTASSPVAITKHGETVGFYIPTRPHSDKPLTEALKRAASQLGRLLSSHGVSEDELMSEFRALKKKDRDK